MECSDGSGFAVLGCTVKKKRSNISRRPRPDAQLFSATYDYTMPPTQPLANISNNGTQKLGDMKMLKKLKLTVGGVTHTIHPKSAVDLGCSGRSSGMNVGMHGAGLESPWSGKDARRSRPEQMYGDNDYIEEEEELTSDDGPVFEKKPRKESFGFCAEERDDLPFTTRNRATSPIEFPNGLPPSKKKEKKSDVEQQLKKAEAAKRRKMQSEKAAKEAEAEAIRKILGQDSGRKKREAKMKKHRDELAEKKAVNAAVLACSTVRWVIGPTGTTVTFAEDVGLPSIFNPVSCSYPPPREKCAGPNCPNAYKYRDSKTKLPLCSLNCYRAVQGKKQDSIAC